MATRAIKHLRAFYNEIRQMEDGETKEAKIKIFREMWERRHQFWGSHWNNNCYAPGCEGTHISFSEYCWKHSTEKIKTKRKEYVTQRRHTPGTAEYFDRKFEGPRRARDKAIVRIKDQLRKLRKELEEIE